MENVQKRIKAYLTEHGIKQGFLAEKLGVADSIISAMLNGNRNIDCIEYFEICRALDVPLETFFE